MNHTATDTVRERHWICAGRLRERRRALKLTQLDVVARLREHGTELSNGRVVITSVAEGADKPQKYPHMFRTADLIVLNKIDLLPYVDFDLDRFADAVGVINPTATVRHTSATRGDGVDAWLDWLRERHAATSPAH
jgi:hypothetical protein